MQLLLSTALVTSLAVGQAKHKPLKPLEGVTRILFLGDSITYAGGYVAEIEAFLYRAYPERRFEVINCGLPSETLSGLSEPNHAGGAFPRPDLHERLERVLGATKPDLVVACYGMNDGIYYPLGEERFVKYREGYEKLRATVLARKARFWVLTPPPFDAQPIQKSTLPAGLAQYPSGKPYEGYDDVLTEYSRWLMARRKDGWNVLDVHTPLKSYLLEQRKTNPSFAFAGDGVHLDARGHKLVSDTVIRGWGGEPLVADSIGELVRRKMELLRDAWLTSTGHKRPGMRKIEPLADAVRQAAEMDAAIRGKVADR